jgi:hypothetical protein
VLPGHQRRRRRTLFLSRLKGPPEEDIRFLFLVSYTALCKNPLSENPPRHPASTKLYLATTKEKITVLRVFLYLKVFTGTTGYCSNTWFPTISPQWIWEIPHNWYCFDTCQPFLFYFWYPKTHKFSYVNETLIFLTNSKCYIKYCTYFYSKMVIILFITAYFLDAERKWNTRRWRYEPVRSQGRETRLKTRVTSCPRSHQEEKIIIIKKKECGKSASWKASELLTACSYRGARND